jgi:hypothetical protein
MDKGISRFGFSLKNQNSQPEKSDSSGYKLVIIRLKTLDLLVENSSETRCFFWQNLLL